MSQKISGGGTDGRKNWDHHFPTIGVNGANEMVMNFTNGTDNIATVFGKNLVLEVMDFIRTNLADYQETTGNLYNLEATPAEGCAYRFAKTDKKEFPDISDVLSSATDLSSDSFNKKLEAFNKAQDDYFNSFPCPKFNLKYAECEKGKPDILGAVAASFEELGQKVKVSVEEMTSIIKGSLTSQNAKSVSAKALDVNHDGNIDLSEYASSIIVEDMLSNPEAKVLKNDDINGEITNDGQNKLLAFVNKNNYDAASKIFAGVHKTLNLESAQAEFLSNPNNLGLA